jgi:hypothetical protein
MAAGDGTRLYHVLVRAGSAGERPKTSAWLAVRSQTTQQALLVHTPGRDPANLFYS